MVPVELPIVLARLNKKDSSWHLLAVGAETPKSFVDAYGQERMPDCAQTACGGCGGFGVHILYDNCIMHTVTTHAELRDIVNAYKHNRHESQHFIHENRICQSCLRILKDLDKMIDLKLRMDAMKTVARTPGLPGVVETAVEAVPALDFNKPLVVLQIGTKVQFIQADDATIAAAKTLAKKVVAENNGATATVMNPSVVFKRAEPPIIEQSITLKK